MDKTACWSQSALPGLKTGKWRAEKVFRTAVGLMLDLLCVLCCSAILMAPLAFGSRLVLLVHELTGICLSAFCG